MRAYWDALEQLPSLAAVRAAAGRLSRRALLEMLQWNDPNSVWIDRLAGDEDIEPATKEEAVDAVVRTISESVWSAKDPRRALTNRRPRKNPMTDKEARPLLASARASMRDAMTQVQGQALPGALYHLSVGAGLAEAVARTAATDRTARRGYRLARFANRRTNSIAEKLYDPKWPTDQSFRLRADTNPRRRNAAMTRRNPPSSVSVLRAVGKAQPTGKYWVYLSSVGNPDFGQYAPLSPATIAFADSVRGLRAAAEKYQRDWDLGGGNWVGAIFGSGRVILGHFSYNLRAWEGLPGPHHSREIQVGDNRPRRASANGPGLAETWDRSTGAQRRTILRLAGVPAEHLGIWADSAWSEIEPPLRSKLSRQWAENRAAAANPRRRMPPALARRLYSRTSTVFEWPRRMGRTTLTFRGIFMGEPHAAGGRKVVAVRIGESRTGRGPWRHVPVHFVRIPLDELRIVHKAAARNARLGARGGEVARWEKVTELAQADELGTIKKRWERVLRQDNRVLEKYTVWKAGGGRSHDWGWKVWGKLKPGLGITELETVLVRAGFRRV